MDLKNKLKIINKNTQAIDSNYNCLLNSLKNYFEE